jgi:hypothetical protein
VAKKLGLAVAPGGAARAVLHGRFENVPAPSERVDMHLFTRRRYAGVNYLPDGSMNVSLVTDLDDVKSDLEAGARSASAQQLCESSVLPGSSPRPRCRRRCGCSRRSACAPPCARTACCWSAMPRASSIR